MKKLKTINATLARDKLVSLINEVAELHRPVLITAKRGNVVLVGEDDWNLLYEELYTQSVLERGDP